MGVRVDVVDRSGLSGRPPPSPRRSDSERLGRASRETASNPAETVIHCLSLCSLCLCGEIFCLCFLLRRGVGDLMSRGVPRCRS
jgi:hypothetical protein